MTRRVGYVSLLGGLAAGLCLNCERGRGTHGIDLQDAQTASLDVLMATGGAVAATGGSLATGGSGTAAGGAPATGGISGTGGATGAPDAAEPRDSQRDSPDVPHDSALAATRYPSEKYLAWQAPAGARNRGPALVVSQGSSGGGTVVTWDGVDLFPPERPVSGYAGSYTVSADVLNDLFTRLAGVDFTSLPHPASAVDCAPTLYFRQCQDCPPTQLNYYRASQLAPEIDPVWGWFDSVLTSAAVTNPRNYCNL